MNINDFLLSLKISPGQSTRLDCPFCGHKKTFSVSNIDGSFVWNCFHALCKTTGKYSPKLSVDNIRHMLHHTKQEEKFVVPKYFVPALNVDKCVKTLQYYNSLNAYAQELVRIDYDPKQDRLVFIIVDQNSEPIDAVGRSFSNVKPKWLRYGGTGRYPLVVGDIDWAILVEDCFSACAVSNVATGIALLGTEVLDEYISVISNYSRIVIALDKDATEKTIRLQQNLSLYAPTSIFMLDKDLKYYNQDAIKALLRNA